jgi:deoxyhypusine synthase
MAVQPTTPPPASTKAPPLSHHQPPKKPTIHSAEKPAAAASSDSEQAISPRVTALPKPHERTLGHGAEHGMQPIEFPDSEQIKTFCDLAAAMRGTTAGGRDVGQAVDVVRAMIADKKCFRVLTLSGNATPLSPLIGDLIDRGIINCIVSTGSICTHSFSVERGRPMFQITDPEAVDDNWFYAKGYNRIYDCVELEESLNEGFDILRKLVDGLDPESTITSADILDIIGAYLNEKFPKENGIIHAAQRNGVPIFIPAFTDCELGLDLFAITKMREKEGKATPMFDAFGDWERYADYIKDHTESCGIITLGGGTPRNWAQQVGPSFDILTEYGVEPKDLIMRFKYAVRICTAPSTEAGLSGCGYCLHGDTMIEAPRDLKKHPKGIPIRELVGKSGFPVYSYDRDKQRIVLSNVAAVFPSGKKKLYKVKYSWTSKGNARKRSKRCTGEVVASADHQFLMRNGTYKKLSELSSADRLMPFNAVYKQNGYAAAVYRHVYTNSRKPSRLPEHRMIAEHAAGRPLVASDQVHHIDHCPWNNSPDNLQIMTPEEHSEHHGLTAPREQRQRQGRKLRELYSLPEVRERRRALVSGEMNPRFIEGLDESVIRTALGKHKGVLERVAEDLGVSVKAIKNRMRMYSIPTNRCRADAHNRFVPGLSEEVVREALVRNRMFVQKACRDIGVSHKVFYHRMAMYGIPFPQQRVDNHVVESIEYWGEDETFDMTVDGTHNFAANSVILKNSEGRSWGKFWPPAEEGGGKDKKGKKDQIVGMNAEVVGDYTIAFPLIAACILEGDGAK